MIRLRLGKLNDYFHIDSYLFGDAGMISHVLDGKSVDLTNMRLDAGAGFLLTITQWGPLEMTEPLSIRFDMPFFLNRPPYGEEYLAFRWLIGINRAF